MFKNTSPKIEILKFTTEEVGDYTEQFHRPYALNIDIDNAQILVDRVKELEPNESNMGAYLTDIRKQVLMSGVTNFDIVKVPGGWRAPRLKFQMTVKTTSRTGSVKHSHYCGYSTSHKILEHGVLDDSTEFYLNSVREIHTATVRTPDGLTTEEVQSAAYQFQHNDFNDHHPETDPAPARVQDIFTAITSNQLMEGFNDTKSDLPLVDMRLRIPNAIQMRPSESIGTRFLAQLIGNYVSAKSLLSYGEVNGDAYSRAREFCYVNAVVENAFMRALATIVGEPNTVHFTMAQLRTLDKDNGGHVVLEHQHVKTDPLAMLYYQYPVADNSNDVQTVVQFVREFEGMLSILGIRSLTHSFLGGVGKTTNSILTPQETILLNEILPALPCDLNTLEALVITCDLEGDSAVLMQRKGEEPLTYRFPTFMNGLYTPQRVKNIEELREMAEEVTELLNML